MQEESKPGSRAYARQLAAYLEADDGEHDDGRGLGKTDCEIAATALRSFAGRWWRRAAVALAIVAPLVIGLPDLNGDGRVGLGDLAAAVRMVVPGA